MKLCMKSSTRKSVVVVVVVFSPDFPVQTFLFVCWFCLFVLLFVVVFYLAFCHGLRYFNLMCVSILFLPTSLIHKVV